MNSPMKFSLHHLLAAVAIVAIYFQMLQVFADRQEIKRLQFLYSQEYERAVRVEKDFAPDRPLDTFQLRVLKSYQPLLDYQTILDRYERQVKQEVAP
jgi:hypothetical protein